MSVMNMNVATCTKCRAWYSVDFEDTLPNEHFDMRTGEPCPSEDNNWYIVLVPYRVDWRVAN